MPYRKNSSQSITISPGKNLVPMCFDAKVIGEFVPLCVTIQVGQLLLIENIEIDVNKLHNFFETNTLISIVKPSDQLRLNMLAPRFTPVGFADSVLIDIGIEEKDELNDVRISVHSVHLDKPFARSLLSVEDDEEREQLISHYIEASGEVGNNLQESYSNTEPSGAGTVSLYKGVSKLSPAVADGKIFRQNSGSLTENKVPLNTKILGPY